MVCISTHSNLYGVLCLWDIQLTHDWNSIESYGAYQCKSELTRCKCVKEVLKSNEVCGSYGSFRTGKVNANGQ